jgi:hypothetical protein
MDATYYQTALGPVRAFPELEGHVDARVCLIDDGVLWANWFRGPGLLCARQGLLSESSGVEWRCWVAKQSSSARRLRPAVPEQDPEFAGVGVAARAGRLC